MLKNNLKNVNEINFDEIASKLDGYSGSDIFQICKEVKMKSIRKQIEDPHENRFKKTKDLG